MDELHSVALEEIALEGKRGCPVSLLWLLLGSRLPATIAGLSLPLKQHLWQLLRSDSSFTFSTEELQAQAREAAKQAGPPKKKKKKKKEEEEEADYQPQIVTEIPLEAVPENVSEAEEAGIVLVALKAARLAVVGVYDELEANHKLSEHQLAVLEMVGQRRHHGAVQTDMANELGVQHRNFFYVLKMLEARHMIVRNKLMVPMPSSANNSGWSTTSIVHLPRFAPRVVLGAEAVFKEVQTAQGQQLQQQAVQQQGQTSGSYVVRDDATVMQQICEFLGSQSGKYVSESQVKAMLGFTGSATAHRQWRRLRTRLIKLGCIAAELGMVGEKAISVLRLVKPYKLRLPVVVNSDEEQEEAGGGDDGDEADGPADKAAEEAEQEAEGDEGGEGTAATAGGSKLPVEVGREQLMLEIICAAGEEGVLTPDLGKRLGLAPKLLLRAVPELNKKYGVKVEYDMPNKALTNRLIAPQHLLDKYNQQRHLLGITQASAAGAASLQGAGSTAQQHPPPSPHPNAAAAASVPEQQDSAEAAPAAGAAAASHKSDRQQQLQQHAEEQPDVIAAAPCRGAAGASDSRSDAPGAPHPAGAEVSAATGAANSEQQQQQSSAGLAADGGDAMELDDGMAAAVIEAMLRQAAAAPAESAAVTGTGRDAAAVPAGLVQEPEIGAVGADATAAGARSGVGHTVDATGGASAAVLRPAGKRLAGLSNHPSAANAMGATAAALAKGALYGVRAVTAVAATPMPQQAVSGDQQAASSAQPVDADAGAVGADSAAAGGVQGNLSRLQQRRLQILKDRLQESGFLMKQELRRLIMNAEIQPATVQRPHNLYDPGPDSKTCNRLIGLLIDSGAAKAVKLQYHQEAVLEPKEVEVFLRADIEQTPELFQRIAVYDAELPGNLRREGMRRALLAQGLVGRAAEAAAAAAGTEGPDSRKNAFANIGLRVASEHLQMLPVAANMRGLPGYGRDAVKSGTGRPRGISRRSRNRAVAAADWGAGASGAPAAARDRDQLQEVDVEGIATEGANLMAASEATQQQQPSVKKPKQGQEIQQLHHNGYIPSLMLRVKLLHQYLCACVNLKVEPHDDIPQPLILESTGQTAATLSSSGFAATGRPAALRRLQFVLVDGDQEQQQGALLQQEGVGAEGRVAANHQGGLFQLSRPTRAAGEPPPIPGAGDATASAADGIAEGAVAATETEVDQQQQEALEQQLGGRLLSVSHLWANMPLAVALSVGGSSLRICNLLQLLSETTPPPRIESFNTSDLDTVFGDKTWKRIVTGLAVLTKLRLVTPARKGGPMGQHTWTQCHPIKATHLVIGTLGVLDEPNQGADVGLAHLDFHFTQTGQWGQYWSRMQSLYDTPLFSAAQLQRFFPASSVPDVARHRCWVIYRDMSLVPYLRLRSRLEGLPIEQLDMHMARQVAEELGLTYTQVHQCVTRLRTEINEQRQKAGLQRIYLLNKAPEGAAAAEAVSKRKSKAASQHKAERVKRRRKHERRRLKRLRQQQQEQLDGSSLAGSGTTGIPSGSESDSESAGDSEADSEQPAAAADETDLPAGAAGGPLKPLRPSAKKRKDKKRQEGVSAAAEIDASSTSGSETDESSGEGRQQRRASALCRQLPKILIELAPADDVEQPAAGAAAGEQALTAAAGTVGNDRDSEPGGGRTAGGLQGETAVGDGAAGFEGAAAGGTVSEGVAARTAGKRHRWTPQQDRQLLRWVVQQRVELGTRGQVRWSHAAPGLPLRVDLCTRRYHFLKKNKASSKFIASLEAQATDIHKDFSSRRILLQQHLSKLQQESRLSANPLLLAQRQEPPADAAAEVAGQAEGQQQQQQEVSQTPILVPADYEFPLKPLPGGQQQQQQIHPASAEAAAAGGPGTAAAWLSAAGPHSVTAQGNIVLLPDDAVKAKHHRLLEQIEEFVTPRQQQMVLNREKRSAAGARAGGGDGPLGLRPHQRRRRGQGVISDQDDGVFEDEVALGDSDAAMSSGESEAEDEWALLTNAAGPAGAAHQRRRSTGQKHRSGSRQIRPLKTVADRVAHSAALLAAAAAAAAAVIAQRRAAGEQVDAADEERERQLQLQAYIEGRRKRRGKQRKQQQSSAIANPRDLIQSWRRHHAGVEARPAAAKAQQAGAAATAAEVESSAATDADAEMAPAAAGGDQESPTAMSRELTPAAEVDGQEAMEAAAAQQVAMEAAAAGTAAAAAWPHGPAPSAPVVCAMHLITSLLHLVAEAGSLPADASLALLLRFSQAEVAAAFRWLRALGWLNSGAARRPFQLSSTWNKRLRGEGVLADLLDRAPAAQLTLRQLGLLGQQGKLKSPGNAQQVTGNELVGSADAADGVSQQLLAGLQQLEQDKARAAEAKKKQKAKLQQQQQQQGQGMTASAAADVATDAMDIDEQERQQQQGAIGTDTLLAPAAAAAERQDAPTAVEPVGREVAVATASFAEAAAVNGNEAVAAQAADKALPSTPKAVDDCLSVLHPVVIEAVQSHKSTGSAEFWVGLQPAVAAAPSLHAAVQPGAPAPRPVPGGLLLEVIMLAAAGAVQLRLCPVAHRSMSLRGVARGEAAALSQKPPQILVQLAASAGGATEGEDQPTGSEAAPASGEEADAENKAATILSHTALLTPGASTGAGAASSSVSVMAYCCSTAVSDARGSLTVEQPGTPTQNGETATASRKRVRDGEVSQAGGQQFLAVDVARDILVRQQAEAACLADAGEQAADAADGTTRPSKRQRMARAEHGTSSSSSVHQDIVHALLSAVRGAGPLGVSTSQLLQQWQQAHAPSAAADAPAQVQELHKEQETLSAGANALAEAGIQTGPDLAASVTEPGGQKAKIESEVPNAFAALPEVLRCVLDAEAVHVVSAGLALLQQYGLVRRVPGWHQCLWVSSEGSQRLLAWPLPQQADQQQERQQQQQQAQPDGVICPQLQTSVASSDGTTQTPAGAQMACSNTASAVQGISMDQQQGGSSSSNNSESEVLVAPWLDHKGRVNARLWHSLVKRIMGVVLRNPGIPESLLVAQLDVISPAAAREALSMLVQEKHLIRKSVMVPGRTAAAVLQVASSAEETAASAGSSSSSGAAAKKITSSAGTSGYGGWGGGAIALRLGAGLTNCHPSPAKPPSLLCKKKSASAHTAAGDSSCETARPVVLDKLVDVLHYWPSLTTSTTCHLTCMPRGCQRA